MKRLFAVIALVVAFVFAGVSLAGAQVLTWNADQIIDGDIGTANYEPGLVMQGANAVAVWRSSQGGLSRIVSCYSADYGITWSGEQLVDDGTNTNDKPIVAMDGSNVVAMFKHFTGEGYRYYADYSADNGVAWNTDSVVSDAILSQDDLVAAVSGNNVVALWRQYDGVRVWNIFRDYSADGGNTWHTDQKIEGYDTFAERPDVVICENNAVAVWRQKYNDVNRIASNFSTDGGANWYDAQIIDSDPENHADTPKLAIADDRIIAVWSQYDTVSSRIYSCSSDDWGMSWSTPAIIDNNPGNNNYDPQIASDGDRAVVVWRGLSGIIYHGYAVSTSDNGETWTVPAQLDDNPYSISEPLKVEMCCKKTVALWRQDVGLNYRMHSNYSNDGGATWNEDVLIEDNAEYSAVFKEYDLAMACGNAVAVWRQSDGGKQRIYSNYGEFGYFGGGGSGCFIATAAFGSPYERHVKALREFRDSHLLTNRQGRAFVRWYYRHSPTFADYIRRRPAARVLVRTFLRPLAWLVSLL